MKTLLSCILFTAVSAAAPLVAQDSTAVPLPAESPGETGTSNLDQPVSLMPQTPSSIEKRPSAATQRTSTEPATPGLSAPLPEARKSKTVASEQDLQQRVRFREIKTRAVKDPGLQKQWAAAQAATTDPQKRAILRDYYTRLYTLMLKMDTSLAPRIEQQKRLSMARLDQSRVQSDVSPDAADAQRAGED